MIPNVIVGILFAILSKNLLFQVLGILFILAPLVAYKISKENMEKPKLKPDEIKELNEIAYRTWNFFEDNINKQGNYLICDNFQEDRKEKVVLRTSSTNIGLELLSIISAYDLRFISLDKAIDYLKKVLNTVKILPKWNGHLYNWYQTDTLNPLKPRYISTVDSGNFVRIFIYYQRIFIGAHE